MSWLDIAIIILILIGAIKGYREGFLMELFSLLGIILGILGGFKLMGLALIYLSEYFEIDQKILPYAAFAVVFLAILIAVTLLGRLIKASIDKSFLGRVDEGAGAVLGSIKMIFLASVVLWIMKEIRFDFPEKWTANSKVTPWVSAFAPEVTKWVSDWIPAFGDVF